jgi:uncharacterized protein
MRTRSIALSLAFTMLAGGVSALAATADSAKTILDKVSKNVNAKDEVATLKMVIVEADGTKKTRELEIRRKGHDESQKVLVKIEAPTDLKGISLLSVSKGKDSDQWMYSPASKQTRRIQSSKRNSSFMDSELSYEDMGTSSDAKFESKSLGEKSEGGKTYTLVENTPKGESSYGKIVIWVEKSNFLVGKMEYFDKAMKPLKVSTFSDYKKFEGGVWRAQKVSVSNLQNKRGTELELSGLKLNKGLDDGEFTESALTEGD